MIPPEGLGAHENRRHAPAEFIRLLERACGEFGVEVGRATEYVRLVREFYERGGRTPAHHLAHFEGSELIDLLELWGQHLASFPGLRERIRHTLGKGPTLREDERVATNTNQSRNNAFSYLTSGLLIRAGADVIGVEGVPRVAEHLVHNADATVRIGASLVDVQCKRPQSWKSMAPKFDQAIDQVEASRYERPLGIVAIDCSTLIRPPRSVLVRADEVAAFREVEAHLRGDVAPVLVPRLKPFILGILLFARAPARIEESSAILTPQGQPYTWVAPYTIRCLVGISNAQCVEVPMANDFFSSLVPRAGEG